MWSLDSALTSVDLLVNEIGDYEGRRPVNVQEFFEREPMRYVDVTADGPWSISFEPLSMARLLTSSLSGSSDDVVRVAEGGIAAFPYTGSSNFIVWARSVDGEADLLVNEIGNYSGNQVIPAWADYLDVVGNEGTWMIELTS